MSGNSPCVLNMHTATPQELEGAIYVGCGSKYGNQWRVCARHSRDWVVDRFQKYVDEHPKFRQMIIRELRGKNLACWCSPKRCHADVLLKTANMDTLDMQAHQQGGIVRG